MAKMIPATLPAQTESKAERRLFSALRNGLDDTFTVFHSFNLLRHKCPKSREDRSRVVVGQSYSQLFYLLDDFRQDLAGFPLDQIVRNSLLGQGSWLSIHLNNNDRRHFLYGIYSSIGFSLPFHLMLSCYSGKVSEWKDNGGSTADEHQVTFPGFLKALMGNITWNWFAKGNAISLYYTTAFGAARR